MYVCMYIYIYIYIYIYTYIYTYLYTHTHTHTQLMTTLRAENQTVVAIYLAEHENYSCYTKSRLHLGSVQAHI